jgi:glycosyltransferase involved in cell wall biosynthesis
MFTEHGRFHPDLPSRKRMVFNRLFLRKSDRVVAVGEAVKQALVSNEGIAATRIEVIYNGVELADFSASAAARSEVRRELGIAPQVPVAIQVARLDYLKDHSTALRTAARVRETLPAFQLLLVGAGPERSRIEAEIVDRNLQNTVQLLGLRTDVRRLLAAADLFLLTSISEGIPVTLIEAMGAELPIVSTDVGGVSEVVVNRTTGLLTKAGDDDALAAAVLHLVSNRDDARRLVHAGSRRAADLFSEAHMHNRYAELYDAMSGQSATPRNAVAAALA